METKIEQLAVDKKLLAKRRGIKAGIIITCIVMTVLLLVALFAVINAVGSKALLKLAKSYSQYSITPDTDHKPQKDASGEWRFNTNKDKPFKIMQLTDIHIGAGFASFQKDKWAMNAVATMIRQEKPDLVMVTGDIAYPVPIQAGTANNLKAAEIFANLMESMGAYWTFCYGNHDTEAYSKYTRKDISEWYRKQIEKGEFKRCLFTTNPSNWNKYTKDQNRFGYGNQIIKLYRDGKLKKVLTVLDSHAYLDSDKFGMLWHYDNIHQEQINWYKDRMTELKEETADNKYPENMAFFHIAIPEYKEAYDLQMSEAGTVEYDKKGYKHYSLQNKYIKNNSYYEDGHRIVLGIAKGEVTVEQPGLNDKNPDLSKLKKVKASARMEEGIIGEHKKLIYSGVGNDNFFETGAMCNLTATFCGHDHYNNMSIAYKKEVFDENGKEVKYKGILLNYGMSIDYLAYIGIYKKGAQRGCRMIEMFKDKNGEDISYHYGARDFITYNSNYYNYQPINRNREKTPSKSYDAKVW